jgi:predicted dithiol-disulfide oxidoreductase (DUF899 family)
VDLPAIVSRLTVEQTRTSGFRECSFVSEAIAGGLVGLAACDRPVAADLRAPIAEIEAFKRRMKRTLPWVSAFANNFNFNFHVTLEPTKGSTEYNCRPLDFRGRPAGLSVFVRVRGQAAVWRWRRRPCPLL